MPPDKGELKKRLTNRNQDTQEIINKRLVEYSKDIVKWVDYDYVIINDNLENCVSQLEKIISDTKNKFKI